MVDVSSFAAEKVVRAAKAARATPPTLSGRILLAEDLSVIAGWHFPNPKEVKAVSRPNIRWAHGPFARLGRHDRADPVS